jgi:hypothetical protein
MVSWLPLIEATHFQNLTTFNMENELSKTEQPCTIHSVKCSTCLTCKHWGAQGTIGLIDEGATKDVRACMAFLFGDMDNEDFRPMPYYKITWGSNNGAKGQLVTHKDFGCINHNGTFEE